MKRYSFCSLNAVELKPVVAWLIFHLTSGDMFTSQIIHGMPLWLRLDDQYYRISQHAR